MYLRLAPTTETADRFEWCAHTGTLRYRFSASAAPFLRNAWPDAPISIMLLWDNRRFDLGRFVVVSTEVDGEVRLKRERSSLTELLHRWNVRSNHRGVRYALDDDRWFQPTAIVYDGLAGDAVAWAGPQNEHGATYLLYQTTDGTPAGFEDLRTVSRGFFICIVWMAQDPFASAILFRLGCVCLVQTNRSSARGRPNSRGAFRRGGRE